MAISKKLKVKTGRGKIYLLTLYIIGSMIPFLYFIVKSSGLGVGFN